MSPPLPQSVKDDIEALLRQGRTVEEIRAVLKVSRDTVAMVRQRAGLKVDRRLPAAKARHARIREMAEGGYTSAQIAAEVGITESRLSHLKTRDGIQVRADKTARRGFGIDQNRVMETIANDAEALTEGLEHVAFDKLDQARLAGWLETLCEAQRAIGGLVRLLRKERARVSEERRDGAGSDDGEARAQGGRLPEADVQGPHGADSADEGADGGGEPAAVPPGVGEPAREGA